MACRSSKVVVIGDGMVGKTALLSAFVNDTFQSNYTPTVFDTTSKDVELVGNRYVTLGLWDTGGQEEFDTIRQLSYPGACLIIICYAVDSPTSLENVLHIWISDVTLYCPGVPVILVGCKSDRRQAQTSTSKHPDRLSPIFVDPKVAHQVSKQIGAHVHLECSAQTRSNVHAVFEIAALLIADREDERRNRPSKIKRMLSFNREKTSTANGSLVNRSCNSDVTERRSRYKPMLWCYGRQ